jgi:hypothetical protein
MEVDGREMYAKSQYSKESAVVPTTAAVLSVRRVSCIWLEVGVNWDAAGGTESSDWAVIPDARARVMTARIMTRGKLVEGRVIDLVVAKSFEMSKILNGWKVWMREARV